MRGRARGRHACGGRGRRGRPPRGPRALGLRSACGARFSAAAHSPHPCACVAFGGDAGAAKHRSHQTELRERRGAPGAGASPREVSAEVSPVPGKAGGAGLRCVSAAPAATELQRVDHARWANNRASACIAPRPRYCAVRWRKRADFGRGSSDGGPNLAQSGSPQRWPIPGPPFRASTLAPSE